MEDKPNIVGTWRVVDAISRDTQGKELSKPFGPKGMGIVTLNADGRMMAVLCDGRAQLPDEAKREYSSYCGNYTFDGATLITKSRCLCVGAQRYRKRSGA
jgi:Lipocalin-like domain